MGSSIGLPDNVEVSHQSGISRACNSILVAVCLAPLALIGSTILLGWNEQRAVCDSKAIVAGRDRVKQVGCSPSSSGDGGLVMFSCEFRMDGLSPLTPGGDFSSFRYYGTGLQVQTEMLQCVESRSSSTTKDAVGGGSTTVTTYHYSLDWRSQLINSREFSRRDSAEFRVNCGGQDNPSSWPPGVPVGRSIYVPSLLVGDFRIPQELVSQIPLETPVLVDGIPSGWTETGGGVYVSRTAQAGNGIGRVRVSLKGTDWEDRLVTVLGENRNGLVGRWTAPSSWLCSGFELGTLVMGQVDKASLFSALEAKATTTTWVLRFVGFLLCWAAFACCFKPLEVAGDCIPCIGPCIGDSVALVTSCISCLPATACTLGVIGIVWIVMRPLVGVPLFIAFLLLMIGFGISVWYAKARKGAGMGLPVGEPIVMGRYVVNE